MGGNVETVQGMYAAFAAGDVAGILSHLAPDVEWEHDWGMEPPSLYRPRRGREAVAGFFALLADLEFLRFEPIAYLAGGDMVAVPLHVEVRHRGTGRTLRDLTVHLWTFGQNGLASRFRHVVDTQQAARMLGET